MGRPKGSVTKPKMAARSRTATTKINEDAKPGKIAAVEDKDGFTCLCCGKHYERQKPNFPASFSPLFAANNGKLPWCKKCVDQYYDQLAGYFSGNEEKAIERMCQLADWYYSDQTWAMTANHPSDSTRAGMYPSKMQLSQNIRNGTTYLDTIRERASAVIQDYDEFEDLQEQGETGITKRQIKTWGLGYEEAEYKQLDEHYRSLRDVIDTSDMVQDTLARDLCEIKIQQIRARNKGDADTYQKFVKLYQDTLKTVNIQAKKSEAEMMNDDHACWGNLVRDMERYCPAEYYKDKQLYRNEDGFKDYLARIVARPVRNFFLGTREMDQEFCIDNDVAEDA